MVMANVTDMSTPVTRGELRAELVQLETRFDRRLAHLETKARGDLEIWGGALLARIESGEQRMIERMEGLEQRLLAELARHTKAISESMATQISIIDERYADLPARMSRVEANVFRRRPR
jgi:hypothetical protein